MKTLLSVIALVAASAFAADVNELIPKLADVNVGNRYDAQMELQALASQASRPGNENQRAAFAAALAAKAADAGVPQPARVWMVRQLEYMGRGEAVAALTTLLQGSDAELGECARRALEKNPDPAATAALRSALEKGGDGVRKTGLIQSLGEKRDAKSVKLIAASLNDGQAGVAAAQALGKIASPAAVEALWGVVGTQRFAAESLICAAHRLGNDPSAKAIAVKLFAEGKDAPVRAAALAVLAKADPAAAGQRIPDAICSSDVRLQKAAVDVAPVAFGAEASPKLAALLPRLSSTAKVFALRALEPCCEKAVTGCVADPDATVRVVALEVLARAGSSECVPVLVKAATTGGNEEKDAAATSLGRVNGRGAAEAVRRLAAEGDADSRATAIAALALRHDTASLPALFGFAREADVTVSKAALASIGKIGSDESLDELVKLVLANISGAKEALQTVANRCVNKSATGRKLVAQAQNASGAQLAAILDVMSLVGGEDALNAIVQFAAAGNDEVKDGAIRALCNWREFAATKPLLDLAANGDSKLVHQVLALQAICRLVKSAEKEPAAARVAAAVGALKSARRDQEKKQSLSALASVADRKAAEAILPLLSDPAMRMDAAFTALNLADKLRKQERGTAKKLAEAVKKAAISPELTQRAEESLAKK